jgi:hypothetical protein
MLAACAVLGFDAYTSPDSPCFEEADLAAWKGFHIMDWMLSVNFWFLATLCLLFFIAGVLIGGRLHRPGPSLRHY